MTPDSSRTPPLEPRIVRVPVAVKLAPERAALLVRDDVRPFALIGRWAGGGALIGSDPVKIATEGDDPFALLDEQLPLTEHAGAVGGGWFGWLGYELGQRLEAIAPSPPPARTDPPFRLAYYDHLLHLDPDGRWWFEALWTEPRARTLRMRVRAFEERAARAPKPQPFATTPWRATPGTSGHALAVGACRERIRAGDLFQANICVRLESHLSGAPIDLFARAVERLRPDRAAFLSDSSGAVASLSPELFLERHGRRVRSAPIKGTRPRPGDPRLAARERAALEASEKDRAENVMIVDLVRNDLGRVCRPGSIHVDALAEARAHTGVWHLVSEVSGVVRDGVGDGSLVRAAFPPGSVSGAPKVAAMNVIAELESTGRQLYTGAVGFASPLAGLELSVAIRTFEFDRKRAWLGVGGGIVADSEPLAEAAECATKAAPLLAAIGATVAAADPAAPSHASSPPPPRRLGPRPVPRPDPADGVFETLLVIDGRPVELERHLDRLSDSMRQLYRKALPGTLERELRSAASGLDQARMRVDLRPGPGGGLRREIDLTTVAGRPLPVRLIPVTVPGGLGCHKWRDRRLLAALASDGGAEPLLCDLDGAVLEAGRANVFVVEEGGRITTPPLDGRILPGVTRARVLEFARALALNVRVESVELARLATADEIFVTGSLGGVEPATLAGGVERARSDGEITSELARAWRAWSRVEPADRTALAG